MNTINKPTTLREEFQEFADSIIWSNDDGSEKYIGVGNMADWWLSKFSSLRQKELEELVKKIGDDVTEDISRTWDMARGVNQERRRIREIILSIVIDETK